MDKRMGQGGCSLALWLSQLQTDRDGCSSYPALDDATLTGDEPHAGHATPVAWWGQ
jgi:hypothetical protein